MRSRNETLHSLKIVKKSPTVTVHHHQPRHHQHRVPVELQRRAVPGEAAAPLAVPQAHARHAGHAQAQQQQVADVEAHRGPHPGDTCRLEPDKGEEAN